MKLLLDTHALIWWWMGDRRLSLRARETLSAPDVQVYVSAVTAWEVATKFRIGKLALPAFFVDDFEANIAEQGFRQLAVTVPHGRRAGMLPGAHRDPFDRILAAQSHIEDMPLVSDDRAISALGARTFW